MTVSMSGGAARPRPPGPRRGGRRLRCSATVRTALAGAAAVVFFAFLAAVGLAAGATLTTGPASPSLPPALAPARGAVPKATAAPVPQRTFVLTKGAQLATTTTTSGLHVGRPARHPGHPPRPARHPRYARRLAGNPGAPPATQPPPGHGHARGHGQPAAASISAPAA